MANQYLLGFFAGPLGGIRNMFSRKKDTAANPAEDAPPCPVAGFHDDPAPGEVDVGDGEVNAVASDIMEADAEAALPDIAEVAVPPVEPDILEVDAPPVEPDIAEIDAPPA